METGTTAAFEKALGCLLGGLIGDAMGTPSEGKEYPALEADLGWIDDFASDGTDDTIMKTLLARALIRTGGYAAADDWAAEWLDDWPAIFGKKQAKFFVSVLHTAQKLRMHAIPRMAALGNMPSSSSAMSIAPVGIVNACNPRAAAAQAYSIASLIHTHDIGYCQDGAAAIAAAVAEAFDPDASVDSVLDAATRYLAPRSGEEMRSAIDGAVALATDLGDYQAFRSAVYDQRDRFFHRIFCDSRETVPLALAFVQLAAGDVERSVAYAANFGRDADTMATMSGGIAGAFQGVQGIRRDWVERAKAVAAVDQEELAGQLVEVAFAKAQAEAQAGARLRLLA